MELKNKNKAELNQMLWELLLRLNSKEKLEIHKNPVEGRKKFELTKKREENELNLLIQNGVDIFSRDANGDTTLHVAIAYTKLHLATILLGHGLDINVKNQRGDTPMFKAQNVDSLKFCLDSGADINEAGSCNRNILHNAAISRYKGRDLKFIQLIVESGIDINKPSELTQRTPLHEFIYWRQDAINELSIDILRYLIDSGADVNAKARGETVLETLINGALGYGVNIPKTKVFKVLREFGAVAPKHDLR